MGKTSTEGRWKRRPSVHPHACGENKSWERTTPPLIGPPPRVWGKRKLQQCTPQSIWSTPTRVGKTAPSRLCPASPEVHPHACGENNWAGGDYGCRHGPPPRVWGKQLYSIHLVSNLRSTPTRVGKTTVSVCPSYCSSVHPHACGENGFSFVVPGK